MSFQSGPSLSMSLTKERMKGKLFFSVIFQSFIFIRHIPYDRGEYRIKCRANKLKLTSDFHITMVRWPTNVSCRSNFYLHSLVSGEGKFNKYDLLPD